MIEVLWELLDHDVQFFLEHCLNDKFTVVGEEKEAARLTLGFTSFKDCLVVEVGSQRQLDLIVTDAI